MKKSEMIGFAATQGLKESLQGLADMEGITLSSFLNRMATDHVENKKLEARLLADALGLNIKDI